MQREFADVIQKISEDEGGEIEPSRIMAEFQREYLKVKGPFEFINVKEYDDDNDDEIRVELDFKYRGKEFHSEASGNGPIDAVKLAIRQCIGEVDIKILDYDEHSLSEGSHAKAAAYILIRNHHARQRRIITQSRKV